MLPPIAEAISDPRATALGDDKTQAVEAPFTRQ
jgi:hypothetical protein